MRAKDDAPQQTPSECITIYRPQGARLQRYIHARKGRVDAIKTHNGNSTLRQSYTQKTAYRWWRMAYFGWSFCVIRVLTEIGFGNTFFQLPRVKNL